MNANPNMTPPRPGRPGQVRQPAPGTHADPHYGTHRPGETLSPTEARQGSPKKTNLRVLVVSMAILLALGAALTAAFYTADEEITGQPATTTQTSPAPQPEPSTAPTTAPSTAPDQPQQQPPSGTTP